MSHPMPGAGLARSEPRPSQYVFPNNKLSFINKPLPTTASSNKYCVKCAISARKCCWVRSRESANGRAKNFPKQPYLSAIRVNPISQGSSPDSGGAATQRGIPGLVGTAAVLVLCSSADLADTETQSKERETVNKKKIVKRYNEEFKRQAVELLIHSGKRQAQVARELGVSDYTLTLWKRAYLGQLKPGELEGKPLSPEEMLETIRQLQKENEYLKRQREILKKAMSIVGEEPNPGMR